MLKYFNDLKTVCRQMKNRSTSMQHRLMLYFLSIVAVIVCALLVIGSLTDVLSVSKQNLNQGLSMTLKSSASKISQQFDHMNAQGLKLSSQISNEIEYLLQKNNCSFQDLNDCSTLLEELQQAVYNPLNTTMELSGCSGAYVILDVTTNTSLSNASVSRSGLYLRRTSVNDCNPVNSDTVLFRGMKEVARKNRLELHNRWNMEFDTEKFPYYSEMQQLSPSRAVDSYLWSQKESLTGTWEHIIVLVVPVVGSQGEFYGICGVEISELYFQLANPSVDSKFGTIITLLTPQEQENLQLSKGVCGAERRGKFTGDSLRIKTAKLFNTYSSEEKQYFGLSEEVSISSSPLDNTHWMVTVLLPAPQFHAYAARRKVTLVTVFAILLVLMLAMSVFLSHRYVRPITQQISAIQKGSIPHDAATGLSEIDELLRFLQTRQQTTDSEGDRIPEGIREIFDKFIERTKTLTNAEYNILEYYIEGYQIMEIPDLAYISMSTVRRHNRSIYEKLGVASRDELMLYIDLLRRCGRLGDLRRCPKT